MKSIENRLSAIEKTAAKSQAVTVTFSDNTNKEMDLLQAVRLLLSGDVREICRAWRPGEMEIHLTGTILEIEKYIQERHNGKEAAHE